MAGEHLQGWSFCGVLIYVWWDEWLVFPEYHLLCHYKTEVRSAIHEVVEMGADAVGILNHLYLEYISLVSGRLTLLEFYLKDRQIFRILKYFTKDPAGKKCLPPSFRTWVCFPAPTWQEKNKPSKSSPALLHTNVIIIIIKCLSKKQKKKSQPWKFTCLTHLLHIATLLQHSSSSATWVTQKNVLETYFRCIYLKIVSH